MSTVIEERERRIGQNEALFREVNERLKALNKTFSEYSGTMEIVCECGTISCVQIMTISPSEYEHVRSDATWFAVIPGHEVAGVEHVVASRGVYDIVQKRAGVPSVQAHQSDPRG